MQGTLYGKYGNDEESYQMLPTLVLENSPVTFRAQASVDDSQDNNAYGSSMT